MPNDGQKAISPWQYGRLLEPMLERSAGYARSILRSRHDAEDAVQQAALRGLQRISTYDPGRPFKAWWFAILRNCCIDAMRSRRRAAACVDPAQFTASHRPDGEDWEKLALGLERLPSEQSEILRLRYFGNLSYRELAQALGIPEGTVMSRLHYARKALAAEMARMTS